LANIYAAAGSIATGICLPESDVTQSGEILITMVKRDRDNIPSFDLVWLIGARLFVLHRLVGFVT